MSGPSQKLVAIAFNKASKNPLLAQFEELLIFGIISQLSRFTDLTIKDMATQLERINLDTMLSYDETLQKLGQICASTRCQYVLTGVLAPAYDSNKHMNQIKVTVRLYKEQQRAYVMDEVTTMHVDAGPAEQLNIKIMDVNMLVNECSGLVAGAIYPSEAKTTQEHINGSSLTSSLDAMQAMLQAHQKVKNSDKLPLYEAAIQADPNLELAYVQLAKLYRLENEFEKSIFYYRKALEVGKAPPEMKAVYATDAGIGCALIGKHDLALQWWQKAIELSPAYINPYFNIANTYEDQENYEQAEAYFLKAQNLAPDDFRTYFNLARIYSKMGAWEKAAGQYQRQLATENDDPWCHSDAATCYLNLGDLENAKKHLARTVQLDPAGEAGQYAQLILSGMG